MPTDTQKLWRGQTHEDRSLKRREQLLDVGEDLLGTAGAGAVTMRAVVREAGLSPRYFYETFDGREDLLIAVYDRVEGRLQERMAGIDIGDDLRSMIHSLCMVCGDFFEEDPRRARILLREPLSDDILRDHSARRAQSFVERVLALLGTRISMDARPERMPALATALSGALVALYLGFADGRLDLDREEVAETAVEIVFALAEAARPRDSTRE